MPRFSPAATSALAHPPTPRSRSPLRRAAIVSVVAAISLVGAACGGGSDDEGAAPVQAEDAPVDAANCPASALDDATGVTEITVWHAYQTLTKDALEAAATEYSASQDKVKVSVEAQGTYPELLKKYDDSLNDPANLPDVIFSEDTTLQYMVDSGSVIAAGDCVAADPDSEEFYGDLLGPVEAAYSVGDKLWAAAFGVSMPIMYVNNDHLEAGGVSTTDYPGTLAELRTAAEQIKAAGIAGLDAPIVMQLYGWYPENWLTGAREEIVNEDNGRATLATESEFDSDLSLEVIEWMNDMAEDGLLKAYPYSSDIPQFLAIAQRTSSILIDGSRAITTVDAVVRNSYESDEPGVDTDALGDADLTGLDVSVVAVPGIEEPGKGAVWGSAAFLVAGEDDVKVAAGWDFLKFFNSPEVQTRWTVQGSYLPVTESAQDSVEIQSYFSDSVAGQWLGVVNQQLLNLDPDFSSPAIGPYNFFRSGLHSLLDDVVLGDADPAAALESFDAAFQDELTSYAQDVGR